MEEKTNSVEDRLYGAMSLWSHAICASPTTKRKRTTNDMVRKERKRQYLNDEEEEEDVDKKCQPWNRETFFKRVSTYSVSKWFAKPVCFDFFFFCFFLLSTSLLIIRVPSPPFSNVSVRWSVPDKDGYVKTWT